MPMLSPTSSQVREVVFNKEQAYSMRFRLMYFMGVVPTYLRKIRVSQVWLTCSCPESWLTWRSSVKWLSMYCRASVISRG